MRKIKTLQLILPWKTEVISSAVIFLSLFLVYLFPVADIFQNFNRSLFFMAILPFLYIKFVLKKNLSDYGFNLDNKKTGFFWAAAMFAVSFGTVLVLIQFAGFDKKYTIPSYIADNFWIFLVYELLLINFQIFINEFFFRGFLLFSFMEKIGYWSIAIQALVYILFAASAIGFSWNITPFIIMSVTGGIVAYRSRSFLYSYFMSLFFMIILDAYIIHLYK